MSGTRSAERRRRRAAQVATMRQARARMACAYGVHDLDRGDPVRTCRRCGARYYR